MNREQYEWSNYWWEDADDTKSKRVLVIGDSITNGYRSCVQQNLKNIYLVDQLATSRSIADLALIKEVSYFLSEYQYEIIHFNNGLHGRDLPIDIYAENYENVLKIILEKCKNTILVTSTPILKVDTIDLFDTELNPMVIERNNVVKEFANKYRLMVDDLYEQMVDKSQYRAKDGYHFTYEGCVNQGELVADFIKNAATTIHRA